MRLWLLCDATAFYLFHHVCGDHLEQRYLTGEAWTKGYFSKAIRTDRKRRILEKPEEFEDDHYNDNHSNYVKDVSVHAGDS